MEEKRSEQGGGAAGPALAPPTTVSLGPSVQLLAPTEEGGEGALLQWMSIHGFAAPRAPPPPATRRRVPTIPSPAQQGNTLISEASAAGEGGQNTNAGPSDRHPSGSTASPVSPGGSSGSGSDDAAATVEARRREQWRQLQALGGLPSTTNRVNSSNISSASAFIERVGLAEGLAAARAERVALEARGAVLTSLLAVKDAEARALAQPGASSASETAGANRGGSALRALLQSGALDAETRACLQRADALCDSGAPGGDAAAAQQRAALVVAAQLSPDQVQRLQTAYRQCRRRVRAAQAQSSVGGTALGRQLDAAPSPPQNQPDTASIRPWHEKAGSHLSCTSLARQTASASREALAAAEDFEFQFSEIMGPQTLALIYIECAPHPIDCVAVSNEILNAASGAATNKRSYNFQVFFGIY